jgi:hypothetical protein
VVGSGPGAGLSYGVGASGDRVMIVREVADGPEPGLTSTLAAYLLDPRSGRATSVDLPTGVLTAQSVCGDGMNLFAIIPHLDAERQLEGVAIDRSGDAGKTWEQLTLLTDLKTRILSGGRMTCLSGSLILEADATPSELLAVNSESGAQEGASIQVGSPISSIATSVDGTELVVAGAPLNDQPAGTDPHVVMTDYVTFTAKDGWKPLGTKRRAAADDPPHALVVGHVVIDASSRARHPSNQSPFPAITG